MVSVAERYVRMELTRVDKSRPFHLQGFGSFNLESLYDTDYVASTMSLYSA